MPPIPYVKPCGFIQVTVADDEAIGLDVPPGASRAILCLETDGLRWRDDGEDPTATVGMLESANTKFELTSREQLLNFKAILTEAESTGILNVSFYR